MPAKDPDVRSGLEPESESETANALRDERERAKERLCMLETQLAEAQHTAPGRQRDPTAAAPPAVSRPPIRLPVFDGTPVMGIAKRVQAEANARGVSMPPASTTSASKASASVPFRPMPFVSMPFNAAADTDDFEPTARLDAGQIRQAHRALARPCTSAHRRTPAALLCLGTAALWCGVWQMRMRDQQAVPGSVPQSASNAPVPADVRAMSATPVVLPEPQAADRLPMIAPAPVHDMDRLAHAPRFAVPASVSFRPSQPLQTPDRARPGIRAEAAPAPMQKPPLARRQIAAIETAASGRHAPGMKSRLLSPATRREHGKAASRPAAWAFLSTTHTPDGQPAAPARPSASLSRRDFGLGSSSTEGSGRSEGAEEQAEAQAQPVRGLHLTSYGHGDRQSDGSGHNDIEANVDHAMQTLDKMRELLDDMDRAAKPRRGPDPAA